jgi:hypothetical protein
MYISHVSFPRYQSRSDPSSRCSQGVERYRVRCKVVAAPLGLASNDAFGFGDKATRNWTSRASVDSERVLATDVMELCRSIM